MDKAYTVNPVYSNEDGSLQGMEVVTPHSFSRDLQADIEEHYQQDEHGNLVFKEVQDPDAQQDPLSFDAASYFQAEVEATPGLTQMVQWAKQAETLDQDLVAAFDVAYESNDLDAFHHYKDMLMEMWEDAGKPGEVLTEQQTIEKWFEELPQEWVDSEMESVAEAGYTYEQADQMTELATSFSTSSIEHQLLRSGVDLAFKKTTFEDASQMLFEQHGVANVVAAYMGLKQLLNKQT